MKETVAEVGNKKKIEALSPGLRFSRHWHRCPSIISAEKRKRLFHSGWKVPGPPSWHGIVRNEKKNRGAATSAASFICQAVDYGSFWWRGRAQRGSSPSSPRSAPDGGTEVSMVRGREG